MPHADYPLGNKNTLGLESTAQFFAPFQTIEELRELSRWARERDLPLHVLGGGSNVLMPEYVKGLVVQSTADGVRLVEQNNDSVVVDVDAGKNWHQWVGESIALGHGLENLALIPGTVGASPVQNIGAYGVEVSDLIVSVKGYHLSRDEERTLFAQECSFGYRDSVFKRDLNSDFIICSVRFKLSRAFSPNLSYAPLNSLQAKENSLTAQMLIDTVCAVRSSKLPDPVVTPNAGSYFKNPVVPESKAQQLRSVHPQLPVYPQTNTTYCKLAAGWLIEQCGFKGKAFGPVAMYSKQALVLTAEKGAGLSDVHALQKRIQNTVAEKFGVTLEPEPQIFGQSR
ncbi:MAG: UDP-N-acetylenolpyruvoylglucosamine reductase [Thalassolituus sp.]|nr:MAG: UDP-N-acetylenolpyruvoylglucosamine reductase [Thalassolituus sp.]